jgi:hypothetical protein
MADESGRPGLLSSLLHLQAGRLGRRRKLPQSQLEPRLKKLREWQANRLATTYQDLLSNPQYGPACRFFLDEIYSARDFSQRDYDAEHAYQVMSRFLPVRMLQTLSLVLQLNQFTAELDQALLEAMDNLGLWDQISVELYTEAYRLCDNYAERIRQIDLIIEVGQGVSRLVSLPMVGMVLRLARAPAQRSGWGELHDFLERGYSSFKQMEDAHRFLRIVEHRERTILEKIYDHHSSPFKVEPSTDD